MQDKLAKVIQFTPSARRPRAAKGASEGAKKILEAGVDFIEEYGPGFYHTVLAKHRRSGQGVSETGVLLDPDQPLYFMRPHGFYQKMVEFLTDKTPGEWGLLYATYVEIDTKRARKNALLKDCEERTFTSGEKFDVNRSLELAEPIVNFYLSKKQPPKDHKLPGRAYPEHAMRDGGLRPNIRGEIAVTNQLAHHAIVAHLIGAM